jgi:phosphoglycolate phosphatase
MPEWSMEEGMQNIARSLRDTFPSMFGDRWQEAREYYYEVFSKTHIERMIPYPQTESMLRTLQDKGIYLAVVSNKTGHFLRQEAKNLGWDTLFGALIGATDAVRDKPDPAPVQLALEPSGIRPSQKVWFVGDSFVDLQCAHQSGCVPVLMRPEPPKKDEFRDFPHKFYVADAEKLLSLID